MGYEATMVLRMSARHRFSSSNVPSTEDGVSTFRDIPPHQIKESVRKARSGAAAGQLTAALGRELKPDESLKVSMAAASGLTVEEIVNKILSPTQESTK